MSASTSSVRTVAIEPDSIHLPGPPARTRPRASHKPVDALPPRVEVIRRREDLERIRASWLQLEAEGHGAVLFQGFAWASAVFDFEAERGSDVFDPVIVTLWEGDALKALLPLERVGTPLRRALVPLGDKFAQYSDLLLAPHVNARTALRTLLQAATTAAPADCVRFLKVREDSALASALPETALPTGLPEAAPYVELSQWPDFESYFATRKSKTRKNMRNARNRLERTGPLQHHVAAGCDELRGVVSRTLEQRAERLREQGLTSRAFATSAFADFCLSLVARDDLPILAMSLRHEGRPLAEQWGLIHNGRYYAYVAARDFGNSDESPGKLHLKEVIETCYAGGLSTADLLVPDMAYKQTWATGCVAVSDYALPLNLRGRLATQLWDQRLRPALKTAILGMPVGLRSTLMRVFRRG